MESCKNFLLEKLSWLYKQTFWYCALSAAQTIYRSRWIPRPSSLPASLHHGDTMFTVLISYLWAQSFDKVPDASLIVGFIPDWLWICFFSDFFPKHLLFALLVILFLHFIPSPKFRFFWNMCFFPDHKLILVPGLSFTKTALSANWIIRVTFLTKFQISFSKH